LRKREQRPIPREDKGPPKIELGHLPRNGRGLRKKSREETEGKGKKSNTLKRPILSPLKRNVAKRKAKQRKRRPKCGYGFGGREGNKPRWSAENGFKRGGGGPGFVVPRLLRRGGRMGNDYRTTKEGEDRNLGVPRLKRSHEEEM